MGVICSIGAKNRKEMNPLAEWPVIIANANASFDFALAA
jgi:hypothetical protein